MTYYTADRKEEESMETRLASNPSAVVWGSFRLQTHGGAALCRQTDEPTAQFLQL